MHVQLNDVEIRVLGVLLEKSLTQGGTYPLTMNAILLGANQKQNRDPVEDHAEADVARALQGLLERRLVKQVTPAIGARANRFAHRVVEEFHWDRRDQAIMAELMLRGRQTAGELRTHASRMTPLPDLEAVNLVLQGLKQADPPWVEELAREPGRAANRFHHLLSPGNPAPPSQTSAMADTGSDQDTRLQALTERVERLEQAMARLSSAPRQDSGAPAVPPGDNAL